MGISSLATKYGFQSFPHYSSGRSGAKVNKIVIHHMAGTNYDIVPSIWQTREASAHYGIGKNGEIRAYVDENNTAWHAGNWNANISSIGIENCNSTGSPSWNVNQATIDSCAKLVADIAKRHGLGKLVVNKNLFPHSYFSSTSCPGVLLGSLQYIADKANAINNGGGSSTPSTPTSDLYRVRKLWADAKSQVGAYKDLNNAKRTADSHSGYKVYDPNGNQVYPTSSSTSNVKTLVVQVNGLNVRNKPSLSGTVVGSYNKGATWTLPKTEKQTIADGWVWARCPIGYCAVGKNTGKTESDDYILIS
ncbi:peptidoglycan recognition protein family protein [Enterococcus faecalis]|uniref:peptidoglycan recognition protein family protein n=1 Tax=Enterococcus faecalis TaxID=1351 RepID=UPI0024BFCD76|nr:peptidoglycan recognition family protein [Enterococcus faecalis]MDK0488510.1 N-acetylmuramoyl-L-alanine amidase [Enterococcus faecalis]MDK0510390.1 N-acetylmuramoyl-L-alanine amidase [Enterococcus faecalis]